MTHARYMEIMQDIPAHDAAMLVKWLLAPATFHSSNNAPAAYSLKLFTLKGGLTDEGVEFAVEHMRRMLALWDVVKTADGKPA